MRVALAEDSALFRAGIAMLLRAAKFEVVYEAASGEEIIAFARTAVLDAVVMDIRMPPTHTDEGLRATETLKEIRPEMGVLALSAADETSYAIRLLQNGYRGVGYLVKDRVRGPTALVDALERVTVGDIVIDPIIVQRQFQHRARMSKLAQLTPRERDVLRLMAEGRTAVGIARALGGSPRTAERHATNAFDKLGIPDGAEDNRRVLAVLQWLRMGVSDVQG